MHSLNLWRLSELSGQTCWSGQMCLDSITTTYETKGHSRKIIHEKTHVNHHKYYFTNRVFALWNPLPPSIVEATLLPGKLF